MATHRCKTQCFHAGHLFEIGEEAQFNPGEKVPAHFEVIKAPPVKKETAAAPEVAAESKGDADKPDAGE